MKEIKIILKFFLLGLIIYLYFRGYKYVGYIINYKLILVYFELRLVFLILVWLVVENIFVRGVYIRMCEFWFYR